MAIPVWNIEWNWWIKKEMIVFSQIKFSAAIECPSYCRIVENLSIKQIYVDIGSRIDNYIVIINPNIFKTTINSRMPSS